ncbi:hypothetical protein KCTC52924_03067 [Arenibacter antarcticus]|uniref:Uncharacterized protein n=1 Tax=Arenibacter antarcticus TaxID=2040469 RepID=A0ABW5VKE2_9FLAO|nr:hypothetical protein [Arenibacter sp. H213]MCM4166146.1 hypothetical protein [Arenibacter sp. H213]
MKLKTTCITGLVLFVVSYWIFTQGNEFAYAQKPIDFAHWLNLIGAVLLINFNRIFPKNKIGKIGSLLTSLGVIAFIGLNTIDFISWSFADDIVSRKAFYNQLSNTPAIAFPIVYVGPSLLFLGLSIHALNFIKSNLIGCIMTVLGAVFMGLGYFLWSNLVYTALGCTIFVIGLLLLLNKIDCIEHNILQQNQ